MFFIQYFVLGGRRKKILLLIQHQIISRRLICSNRVVQFAIMIWPWPLAITSFFQTLWILPIHIIIVFQKRKKKKPRKIKLVGVFNNVISLLSNKTYSRTFAQIRNSSLVQLPWSALRTLTQDCPELRDCRSARSLTNTLLSNPSAARQLLRELL